MVLGYRKWSHASSDLPRTLLFFFQAEDGIRDRNVTGVQTCAFRSFYVNDVLKDTHYIIQDKDDIRMRQAKTIQDFFSDFSIEHKQHAFVVFVNHQQVELPHGETQLLRNGQPAMLNDRLEHDDRIQLSIAHEQTVKDLLQHMDKDYWTSINVTFNKQPIQLKKQNIIITRNQEE